MSIKITEDQLKGLEIKGGGSKWYHAKGEITKKEIADLVNKIIPAWKKLKLTNDEIAMGLSVINMELEKV